MPIPEACLRLQLLPSTQVLLLAPLSSDEAYSLACERLGARALPTPVQESLSQAGGNPYFILETTDLLQESGAVSLQGEVLHVSTEILQGLKIPLSVQGMVASRLDRLDPGQGLALKVASVAGRVFPQALVEAIFPVDEERGQVGEYLQQLEWLELVAQAGPGPLYRFNHPATVELAYNSMLFSQRRQLHRNVAEWYEGSGYPDWGIDEEALADHWLKAGETMRALDYLERAGQSALRRGDTSTAERLFKQALEVEKQASVIEATE
jgi:predicted ATPase